MRSIARFSSMLSVAVLSACTSLTSYKVGSATPETSNGLVYRLPAKQFSVTATFTVTGCTYNAPDVSVDADVKATYTETLVGDDAYRISYEDLSGSTKVSNATFTLSEAGLITGLNSAVTDRSGAVLQNTVVSATTLARAAALPGAQVSQWGQLTGLIENRTALDPRLMSGPGFVLDPESRKALQDALDERKPQADRVKKAKELEPCKLVTKNLQKIEDTSKELEAEKKIDEQRDEARKQVATYQARVDYLQTYRQPYADLGEQDEKDKLLKEISDNKTLVQKFASELSVLGESKTDKLTKKLTDQKAKMATSVTRGFIPKAGKTTMSLTLLKDDLATILGPGVNLDSVRSPMVGITLEAVSDSSEVVVEPSTPKLGIAYRIPKPAYVRVYSKDPSAEECESVARVAIAGSPTPQTRCPTSEEQLAKVQAVRNGWTMLSESITQVPQFGPIGSLDLSNRIFEDNLLEVSFGATGGPTKVTFNSKSQAEAASGALKDATGAYLQLRQDKRQDKIDAVKTDIELATSRAGLVKTLQGNELTAAQNRNTIASLDATTAAAVIKAQAEAEKDQQRLDAIRTGTATAAEVEVESLKTQQDLLTQRLAILKLQVEISEQEAKLKAGLSDTKTP